MKCKKGDRVQDHIFREYDIRGKVGTELLVNQMYDCGRAIAAYYVSKNPALKTVAIGMDGRVHSPSIQEELRRALQDSGLNVIFLGVCPTPVLYFALHTLSVDAGLMITASHNGAEYNGIKICLGTDVVWGSGIKEIRELFKKHVYVASEEQGSYSIQSLTDTYIQWLVDHFPHLKNQEIHAVFDCANGAAGVIMPALVERMGWRNAALLYPEVDGTYPNHEADPVVEENMRDVRAVLAAGAYTIGIGFDGDADRMAPMTQEGVLVSGDTLLALFSKLVVEQNPGAAVVFDIKCSRIVPALLTEWGGRPCVSPSGHSIIKAELKKQKALLGGELSCHFFFKDRYFGYDDGIYASLRLLELLHITKKTLTELLAPMPRTFATREIRIPCNEEDKMRIVACVYNFFDKQLGAELVTIDGIRATTAYGWGIVRASNTQPVLCLRFESDTEEGLAHIKHDFYCALQPVFDTLGTQAIIEKILE